jgi:hypothetical protein
MVAVTTAAVSITAEDMRATDMSDGTAIRIATVAAGRAMAHAQ